MNFSSADAPPLQALRNKSYGVGLDFVWSPYGTGDYAIRESASRVKVYKNFKETRSFRWAVHRRCNAAASRDEQIMIVPWVSLRAVLSYRSVLVKPTVIE